MQSENNKMQKALIGFDDTAKENTVKHNPNWYEIPDRIHQTFEIGSSGSGKANLLLNFINHGSDLLID